jgi:hypothetical protein
LTGKQLQPEVERWQSRRTRAMARATAWTGCADVPSLTRLPAGCLPAPAVIRELAERLHQAALIPGDLQDEQLLTACQWMGVGQNAEARYRIAAGRPLTQTLRFRLGQALWESTHVPFMHEFLSTRRLCRTSASAYRTLDRLTSQLQQQRARVASVLDRL